MIRLALKLIFQMEEVLGFEPSEDVHSNFKKLHDIIFAGGKNYTLTEANKIFSQKGKNYCTIYGDLTSFLKDTGRFGHFGLLLFRQRGFGKNGLK